MLFRSLSSFDAAGSVATGKYLKLASVLTKNTWPPSFKKAWEVVISNDVIKQVLVDYGWKKRTTIDKLLDLMSYPDSELMLSDSLLSILESQGLNEPDVKVLFSKFNKTLVPSYKFVGFEHVVFEVFRN